MTRTASIVETRGQLDRARAKIRTMKNEGQRVTRLATHSMLMTGGGALAGVLRVKYPKITGTEIPSDAALGSAMVLAATLDLAGDMSDELLAIGGGMLAASAASFTEKQLR